MFPSGSLDDGSLLGYFTWSGTETILRGRLDLRGLSGTELPEGTAWSKQGSPTVAWVAGGMQIDITGVNQGVNLLLTGGAAAAIPQSLIVEADCLVELTGGPGDGSLVGVGYSSGGTQCAGGCFYKSAGAWYGGLLNSSKAALAGAGGALTGTPVAENVRFSIDFNRISATNVSYSAGVGDGDTTTGGSQCANSVAATAIQLSTWTPDAVYIAGSKVGGGGPTLRITVKELFVRMQ
jgi:hypothetical protein